MIKKGLLLLSATLLLSANSDFQKRVIALMGEHAYASYAKLLNIIFTADERHDINTISLIEKLKDNGLIALFYEKPTTISYSFTFEVYPHQSIAAISEILRNLGYQFVLTNALKYDLEQYQWDITFNTQSVIDPIALVHALEKYHIYLKTVSRDDKKWFYQLETASLTLFDAHLITTDAPSTQLRDPSHNYWIRADENAKRLLIKSHYLDIWYPNLICYNARFEKLKHIKRDISTLNYQLTLPEETKYIRIRDIYSDENLKHGVTVSIKGE